MSRSAGEAEKKDRAFFSKPCLVWALALGTIGVRGDEGTRQGKIIDRGGVRCRIRRQGI